MTHPHRQDRAFGIVTLRYAGKRRPLGIGRAHPVLMLIHDTHAPLTSHAYAGEVLAEHHGPRPRLPSPELTALMIANAMSRGIDDKSVNVQKSPEPRHRVHGVAAQDFCARGGI